jgi:chromosome segregation ATPase
METVAQLRWLGAIAAAMLLVAGISAVSYRMGRRKIELPLTASVEPDPRITQLSAEKFAADQLATTQTKDLDRLREDSQQKAREFAKLAVQLNSVQEALGRAASDKSTADVRFEEQRDAFTEQIRQREQAYNQAQTELERLKSDRQKTLLRLTSLEQEVETLTAEKAEQSHRANEEETYLAADRDIRELMGARHLYIADVFDVSSDSRAPLRGRHESQVSAR